MKENNNTININNIINALDRAGSTTVTVFGDFCLDKYLCINSTQNEVSVESGLTAYQVFEKRLYAGVGGTITNNLRALGVPVIAVGLVGDDGEGYELLRELSYTGVNTDLMIKSNEIVTGTYTKPMQTTDGKTYTEMERFDFRNFKPTSKKLDARLLENLKQAINASGGVVFTDQFLELDYSSVTDNIRQSLPELAIENPDKFFYADSRGFADSYTHIVVKCNEFEIPGTENNVANLVGNATSEDVIIKNGKKLLETNKKAVIITAGSKGAYVFEKDKTTHVPAFKVNEKIDITGAGDATNAGVILGLTLGLTLPEATLLGCCISSLTIEQIGVTGTTTTENIIKRLQKQSK
jgi:bifunctional ADP-heptose synthase (sugar kinase/adenylyltransferase)